MNAHLPKHWTVHEGDGAGSEAEVVRVFDLIDGGGEMAGHRPRSWKTGTQKVEPEPGEPSPVGLSSVYMNPLEPIPRHPMYDAISDVLGSMLPMFAVCKHGVEVHQASRNLRTWKLKAIDRLREVNGWNIHEFEIMPLDDKNITQIDATLTHHEVWLREEWAGAVRRGEAG